MALQLWKIEEANQETGKRELLCSFGYNTKPESSSTQFARYGSLGIL